MLGFFSPLARSLSTLGLAPGKGSLSAQPRIRHSRLARACQNARRCKSAGVASYAELRGAGLIFFVSCGDQNHAPRPGGPRVLSPALAGAALPAGLAGADATRATRASRKTPATRPSSRSISFPPWVSPFRLDFFPPRRKAAGPPLPFGERKVSLQSQLACMVRLRVRRRPFRLSPCSCRPPRCRSRRHCMTPCSKSAHRP